MEAMFRRGHKSLFRPSSISAKTVELATFNGFREGRARIDELALLIRLFRTFRTVLDSLAGVKLASGTCPARSQKARFLTDLSPHLRRSRRRPNRCYGQFEENFVQPTGKLTWSQPSCSQALPTLRDSG